MKKVKDAELQDTLDNFLPFDGMFSVDTDMINYIMNNELKSINKGEFFVLSVIKKLDKYTELYLKDLDTLIDKVIDSTGNLDIHQFNKLIMYSSRLCSEVYDNFIVNVSRLED